MVQLGYFSETPRSVHIVQTGIGEVLSRGTRQVLVKVVNVVSSQDLADPGVFADFPEVFRQVLVVFIPGGFVQVRIKDLVPTREVRQAFPGRGV